MTQSKNHTQIRQNPWRNCAARLLTAVLATTLSACGSSNGGGGSDFTGGADTAVIATVSSDFASGQVELVDLSAGTLMGSNGFFPTVSDISVATFGDDYYLIEQFQSDRIKKVDLNNPNTLEFNYSALQADDQGSANPYDLIFVNNTKAYLLRYEQNTALIVDPSATQEANFITGQIDLSSYTPDGVPVPRMSAATIIDNRLFITLQRLDAGFDPSNVSCVAVFDTRTDMSIDVGDDLDCGDGIALNGRNPGGIEFVEGVGLVVQNAGDTFPQDATFSSIDRIDPVSYAVDTLVQADTNIITGVAVTDINTGYFLSSAAFGSLDLRRFNPSTGDVAPDVVDGFAGIDLRDIKFGPSGRLWIADATAASPRLALLDPTTDMEVASIATELLPSDIAFAASQAE